MMTVEQQRVFLQTLSLWVREQIAAAVTPLQQEIVALKAKQVQFRYAGVWLPSNPSPYLAGNFVTLGGSLFHCNIDHPTTTPGKDPTAWTLCCKRGQDGKDAAA